MDLYDLGFLYKSTCSLIYNNVETILEVLIYILCLLADIACLIMLRKMLKDPTSMSNEQERTRNKILVMQVCFSKTIYLYFPPIELCKSSGNHMFIYSVRVLRLQYL